MDFTQKNERYCYKYTRCKLFHPKSFCYITQFLLELYRRGSWSCKITLEPPGIRIIFFHCEEKMLENNIAYRSILKMKYLLKIYPFFFFIFFFQHFCTPFLLHSPHSFFFFSFHALRQSFPRFHATFICFQL